MAEPHRSQPYLPFCKEQAAGVGGSPEIYAIYSVSSGTSPEVPGSVCVPDSSESTL